MCIKPEQKDNQGHPLTLPFEQTVPASFNNGSHIVVRIEFDCFYNVNYSGCIDNIVWKGLHIAAAQLIVQI